VDNQQEAAPQHVSRHRPRFCFSPSRASGDLRAFLWKAIERRGTPSTSTYFARVPPGAIGHSGLAKRDLLFSSSHSQMGVDFEKPSPTCAHSVSQLSRPRLRVTLCRSRRRISWKLEDLLLAPFGLVNCLARRCRAVFPSTLAVSRVEPRAGGFSFRSKWGKRIEGRYRWSGGRNIAVQRYICPTLACDVSAIGTRTGTRPLPPNILNVDAGPPARQNVVAHRQPRPYPLLRAPVAPDRQPSEANWGTGFRPKLLAFRDIRWRETGNRRVEVRVARRDPGCGFRSRPWPKDRQALDIAAVSTVKRQSPGRDTWTSFDGGPLAISRMTPVPMSAVETRVGPGYSGNLFSLTVHRLVRAGSQRMSIAPGNSSPPYARAALPG